MSKLTLHGFTVEARVKARCPKGHEFYVMTETIINPTDNIEIGTHSERLKLYLEMAHKTLSKSECESCKRNAMTGWRP